MENRASLRKSLHGLIENPLAQQRKGGSPIALPLTQFEAVDMPFDDAIAVRKLEGCLNRGQISFNPFSKPNEFGDMTGADLL
jgi:hypothetical protein